MESLQKRNHLQDELTKSFQVEINDTLQPPEARGKVTTEVTFTGADLLPGLICWCPRCFHCIEYAGGP
jgi:hypothetical protein